MWIKDFNIFLDEGMHEKVDEELYIHVDEGMGKGMGKGMSRRMRR